MPTTVSQSTLDDLARLIEEACAKGDNVSAIAERASVDRKTVSRIRNGYESSPTLDKVEAILHALGKRMLFVDCE